ncbi:MAG: SMP-30/gluconolactonase/LRE family protein [Acidobacteria bacterium]|nr:MAG: SMP-30/gluconolactonase/LRE family protein [Acidobacteriota bacterium]
MGEEQESALDFELVAEGLEFPEGPIACPDGSVVLVEIAAGRLTRVLADGSKEVVAELGGGPNGAAFGPDGRIYVCNNGGFEWRRVDGRLYPGHQAVDYVTGSIRAVDPATGEVELLYTECELNPLRGPNDIVFDAAGGFWFTDHGKTRTRERDRTGLFYALPDGSSIREMAFPLNAPNGVGLSPEGDRVYVAETETGRVFYWNLVGPGEIDPHPRSPHGGHFLCGLPGLQMFDSLAVEQSGNVCVATLIRGGVTVISPQGEVLEQPRTDDPLTTNLCFGGEDLRTAYVTLSSTGRLVKARWPRPGLGLHFGPRS